MKSAFVATLLAGVAVAQNVAIGAPPPNSTFSPGDQFVVQVNKPVRRFASRFIFHGARPRG